MTVELLALDTRGAKRKGWRRIIARLHLERGVIDGAAVQARTGSGLEPPDAEAELRQVLAQSHRRKVARAARRVILQPDVDEALEKGAGGEDHTLGLEGLTDLRFDAAHAPVLDQQPLDARLADGQIGRDLEHPLHARAIGCLVGLRAARPYGRTFARIEEAELDSGLVDRQRHLTAELVDLAHQVALADAADCRIARHLADMVEVEREHQRGHAHARRCERSLDTGMAGTDHDYAECHRSAIMARAARRAKRAAARRAPSDSRPARGAVTCRCRTRGRRRLTRPRCGLLQ